MNLKQLLPVFFIAIILASCSKVYSPALYHQDIAYMPKPASFDSVKSATYVSGGVNADLNSNLADLLVTGQFNVSRGNTFNNFNLAYGAFGVFGDYENGSIEQGDPNYFTDKFIGAFGARASGNFYVHSGNTDYRFIGFEMAYSHEFGSYADFRQQVQSLPNYYVDPRTDLFSIGLTSEILFHKANNTDFQHSIRLYLGGTFGHNMLDDTYYASDSPRLFHYLYPKVSYFIKIKNYFATFEVGENIFLRFGYKF